MDLPLLALGLLGAVALVLLASGAAHLRHPGQLQRGLAAQGVLSAPARRLVVRMLGPVEVLLAVALLTMLIAGYRWTGAVLILPAVLAALLFLGFTTYLALVARRSGGDEIPCACGVGEAPVGPASVLRGAVLAAMSLAGVAAIIWPGPPGRLVGSEAVGAAGTVPDLAHFVVAAAAALALAIAVSLLPAARALPSDQGVLAR